MSATAKVFMSGRSQAVRLPKAFRLGCDEVTVEKSGEKLVLTPVSKTDWAAFFATPGVDADFMADREDAPPAARDIF